MSRMTAIAVEWNELHSVISSVTLHLVVGQHVLLMDAGVADGKSGCVSQT